MQNIKLLLCGFGRIGKIHAKYLEKNGINWLWYDPYIKVDKYFKFDGNIEQLDNYNFTHVLIATPEGTHYDMWAKIRIGFSGKILIEKPVIISLDNLDIFEDIDCSAAMVERFNPTVITLKEVLEMDKVTNIDFTRCSAAPHVSCHNIFEDIGIHDLDLYYYLLDSYAKGTEFLLDNVSKTYCLSAKNRNLLARFIWSKETYFKERKIVVRQTNCTYEADLQEQTVRKYYLSSDNKNIVEQLYVEKSSPIENELMNFLNGNRVGAEQAHSTMIELMDNKNE